MDQDIHGVNKLKNFLLSNYPLTYQLFLINMLIAFVGFVSFLIFNFYLIKNDKSLINDREIVFSNLKNITNFLENNSIVRVPLFDDTCKKIDNKDCKNDLSLNNVLELSDPELEPTIAQQYIIQSYLDQIFEVRVYNDDWIKLVDTKDLYISSTVDEIELSEKSKNSANIFKIYEEVYISLFNRYYKDIVEKSFTNQSEKQKSYINIVSETIKEKKIIDKIFFDTDNDFYQLFSSPIINNNKVFGVVITSYPLIAQNQPLGLTSFNLFNFYILFVLIMISLSFFFARSIVRPIKKLSNLTLMERDKININFEFNYPDRADEIGILSREIKEMSYDLKSQIDQLEKFAADVSHELKNPLTSLQTASELLLNKKISDVNKKTLILNLDKDIKRMNKLISDISNFARIKAEVEYENFEFVDINELLLEIADNYKENKKNISFNLDLKNEICEVLVNKNKLLQAFLNLIDNSISIAKNNTKILLKSEINNNQFVVIKIYDQGKKINIGDKDKIFQRFYSDRDDNKEQHTGLGLSIAREIIISFKGSLELTETDNQDYLGACFMVKLPLKARQAS